jgi:cytoskeleton protein RodZ
MSEEQDKQSEEEVPEREREGPIGGERLAQARREHQISVLEVAKELHLDEAKVRALERNEFDVLGAPVFAKGHLRKYAQLVGVDEDDVFTDYYKMTHLAELPPVVVVGRPRVRRELSPGPWIAVGVVIVFAAVAYWWFASGSRAPANDVAPPAAPESATPAAEDGADTGDDVDDTADDAEAAAIEEAVTAVDEAPATVEESEPEAEPVADGQTRIQLTFSGDCWTEISDATGQRLFVNMGRAGRTVELAGTAPFSVLFGNANNVSVRVDGNEYPVSPNGAGSRTARLTIIKP